MDGEFSPQWRPEPEPGNALEQLLQKASEDPSLHGRLMRALWQSEISTLMPYHPEMTGALEYEPGQEIQFVTVEDADGPFIPAFTSEATAEFCLRKNAPPEATYGLATMPGEMFFTLVNGTGQTIVLNSGMHHNLVLRPEAIAHLVSGEFRHNRPGNAEPENIKLFPVDESSVPSELKDSIRRFCDSNRVPIGVYLFLGADPATLQPNHSDLRVILRLRGGDNDFYNDFSLMIGKLAPQGVELSTGVVTSDNENALDFLQTCTPLWPVLKTV